MPFKSFLLYLSAVSLLSLVVNYFLLAEVTLLKDYLSSGLLGICTFVPLSVIIFHRGAKLYRQEDKSSFISWVMAATLIKLFASLVILIIFARIIQPASNYFIAPFFIFYLLFFIFETVILMRLTKK
jgi:hypothetical protein